MEKKIQLLWCSEQVNRYCVELLMCDYVGKFES